MRSINIALRRSARNQIPKARQMICRAVLFVFLLASGFGLHAQEQAIQSTASLKSEVIAPGIEHIQITRGYKSEKDATGPWFINILRIDLTRARLRMVHAMDEAVGLETVSSMTARYGALAAVNSGYFRTTGTYRGDSMRIEVLNGKLLSDSNDVRAADGLIERAATQELIFGHIKVSGQIIAGQAKHAIEGLTRPRGDNELIIFTPEFHRTTLTDPTG